MSVVEEAHLNRHSHKFLAQIIVIIRLVNSIAHPIKIRVNLIFHNSSCHLVFCVLQDLL